MRDNVLMAALTNHARHLADRLRIERLKLTHLREATAMKEAEVAQLTQDHEETVDKINQAHKGAA